MRGDLIRHEGVKRPRVEHKRREEKYTFLPSDIFTPAAYEKNRNNFIFIPGSDHKAAVKNDAYVKTKTVVRSLKTHFSKTVSHVV